MNRNDYNKLYKKMENTIIELCNKYKIEYSVEHPKYDFSTKGYELKNVPNIGNMTISLEPLDCAAKKKVITKKTGETVTRYKIDLLSVYMRFETYDNKHGLFDSWRFNEHSYKYNSHMDAKCADSFFERFKRDIESIVELIEIL